MNKLSAEFMEAVKTGTEFQEEFAVGVCPHCKATQEYSVKVDKVIWLHRCKQAGNTKVNTIILRSHSPVTTLRSWSVTPIE